MAQEDLCPVGQPVTVARAEGRKRLRATDTDDKTCKAEDKENNKVCVFEKDERPQTLRRSRNIRRVMQALFYGSDNIVVWVPVHEHISVVGIFYREC